MTKSSNTLLLVVVFCLSALFGYQVSTWVLPEAVVYTPTGIISNRQTGFLELGKQRNLLVIGVDQLAKSTPALHSAWLVMYIPGFSHISFVPLYPQPGADTNSVNQVIQFSFDITHDGGPSPDFLKTLKTFGAWWDYVIVLDGSAIAELIESSINQGSSGLIPTSQLIAQTQNNLDNPHEVIENQVRVIHSICQGVERASYTSDPRAVFALLSGHIYTDLSVSQIQQELYRMLASGSSISCEFPTIDGSFSYLGGHLGYP